MIGATGQADKEGPYHLEPWLQFKFLSLWVLQYNISLYQSNSWQLVHSASSGLNIENCYTSDVFPQIHVPLVTKSFIFEFLDHLTVQRLCRTHNGHGVSFLPPISPHHGYLLIIYLTISVELQGNKKTGGYI
jgi:hypothetical protein